jgi:hypothetical protein
LIGLPLALSGAGVMPLLSLGAASETGADAFDVFQSSPLRRPPPGIQRVRKNDIVALTGGIIGMATKKGKQAKPAPRKKAVKAKAKAPRSSVKAAAAPVSASSARSRKTTIRRDPVLEAEIAIAIIRGTTIAEDREWVHQDYHVDAPKRHVDWPGSPHTDGPYKDHVDSDVPHHDSNKSPEPKPPKKDGPHTDKVAGHVDYGPFHNDIKKGEHNDWMGLPHFDFDAPPVDYHVDSFVGHLDEGSKDPKPKHDDLT